MTATARRRARHREREVRDAERDAHRENHRRARLAVRDVYVRHAVSDGVGDFERCPQPCGKVQFADEPAVSRAQAEFRLLGERHKHYACDVTTGVWHVSNLLRHERKSGPEAG